MSTARAPLTGLRVLDFGHTVMGPSATLVLADLGADVIKIEPAPGGDPTRQLKGFGVGYFGYFNRNKRSLAVDLKTAAGLQIARRLVAGSDVLVENFAPGTMERLQLSYPALSQLNPGLIYASLKGFLPGPYQERLALDEVVQMMSGLAYMTGPSGHPLRAGSSVVDITGGLFAVIAIMAALRERERDGRGRHLTSALFESAVFLMGQHLSYAAQVPGTVPPMPERVSAWAIYDVFTLKDGHQIFVGITTDSQWHRFCAAAQRPDLGDDPQLATNNLRIQARARLIPTLRKIFASLTLSQATALSERSRISFAPVARPEDLLKDPHLKASGGLLDTRLPNDIQAQLPALPVEYDGTRLGLRYDPPRIGEHTREILGEIGLCTAEIDELARSGAILAGSASR
ncbi:MAG TPA: CaiB/BaiF CoA-transferase family protein [Candidatus Binataceae bacterium]|nr:CaiB/BaiF CoA-transferase family protein [Candidatus Binataceae bacterium]